jgi:hypothetical protein
MVLQGVFMGWLVGLFSLFAAGVPGWLVFRAFKIPAAIMVGAMVSSAFFAVKGWTVPGPPFGSGLLFQVILGMFIGVRFTAQAGRELKNSMGVALLAGIWWISFPLGLCWLVSRWFTLDLSTSILGTVPGGIAEMSLLALTLNADSALVALMQFFRLTSVLIAMPVISSRISKSVGKGEIQTPAAKECLPEQPLDGPWRGLQVRGVFFTLALGSAGGVLFYMLGVPVGGFVGSMVFTAAATGFGLPVCAPPLMLRHIGQLGLGALIGLNATPETISTLAEMLLTILGTTAAMLGWGIILAFIVQRVTRWNLMTCLLATCPGGITQLASISEELGAEPLRVSLLHLVRLFTIFVVLPPLIKALL